MIQAINILKRSAHKYKPYKPSWKRWGNAPGACWTWAGVEALEREASELSGQLSDLRVAAQIPVALCSAELRTAEEALVKA